MRLAILMVLGVAATAATPAAAQNWLETRMVSSICNNNKAAPAQDTDRVAKRLALTDAQKAALKDLVDASTSAAASTKTALCTDKPDLSTTTGRLAFSEKMAQARLDGLKTVEPKLQAFYDGLDDKQKKAFDNGGRVGGFFDWWGSK